MPYFPCILGRRKRKISFLSNIQIYILYSHFVSFSVQICYYHIILQSSIYKLEPKKKEIKFVEIIQYLDPFMRYFQERNLRQLFSLWSNKQVFFFTAQTSNIIENSIEIIVAQNKKALWRNIQKLGVNWFYCFKLGVINEYSVIIYNPSTRNFVHGKYTSG